MLLIGAVNHERYFGLDAARAAAYIKRGAEFPTLNCGFDGLVHGRITALNFIDRDVALLINPD